MMLLYTAGLLLILYALLMGVLIDGWIKLSRETRDESGQPSTSISIIIAIRNEEHNLPGLLENIGNQSYPAGLLEVIIADDHSTDQGPALVRSLVPAFPFPLRLLTLEGTGLSGKKQAIQHAVNKASGQLTLMTDADCSPGPEWASSTARYYELEHPSIIPGPVCFQPGKTFFTRMQELEFLSLMFSTAGAVSAGFPMLANGANLAFDRQKFLSSGGYEANLQYASGDDVFLLHHFKQLYGTRSARYLYSRRAIVYTQPEVTLKGFWSQRLRWVSKSRGYRDPATILVSVLVFLVNSGFLVLLTAGCVNRFYMPFALVFAGIKLVIDFPAFFLSTGFVRRRALLGWLPLLEVLNALYTTVIGISGNLLHYDWKGRNSKFTGKGRTGQ